MAEREMIKILRRTSQTKYYERNGLNIPVNSYLERIRAKPYLFEAFEDIIKEANIKGRESLFHTHPNGRRLKAVK